MSERDVLAHEIAILVSKIGIAVETSRHDLKHTECGAACGAEVRQVRPDG